MLLGPSSISRARPSRSRCLWTLLLGLAIHSGGEPETREAVAPWNNGQVAYARPTSPAVIDGDPSEWSDQLTSHPIALTEFGVPPTDNSDLNARFAVAWDPEQRTILLAVTVDDDSPVIRDGGSWSDQDGCIIYLQPNHGTPNGRIYQFNVYGSERRHAQRVVNRAVDVAWSRSQGRHTYEWCIHLDRLEAGFKGSPLRTLGLDVVVCDKDSDESFSWVAWGRGSNKVDSSTLLGDLVLLADGEPVAPLRGAVETPEGTHKFPSITVNVRSITSGSSLSLRTNSDGRFHTELPTGRYELRAAGAPTRVVNHDGNGESNVRIGVSRSARTVALGAGNTAQLIRNTHKGPLRSFQADQPGFSEAATAIARDGKGPIWFGTQRGLLRFDGEQFISYGADDGLPDDVISSIAVAADGLWLGTPSGLCRVTDQSVTHFSTVDGLSTHAISALVVDRNGDLWVGNPMGLCRSRGANRAFEPVVGLDGHAVNALATTPDGAVWVGTSAGLFSIRDDIVSAVPLGSDNSNVEVSALAVDSSGKVWAGGAEGLDCWDHETKVLNSITTPVSVTALATDQNGSVWIGYASGLVSRLHGAAIHQGISRSVTALFADDEGGVWWSNAASVVRLDSAHLGSWDRRLGLDGAATQALLTRSGRTLVATDMGLREVVDGRVVRPPEASLFPNGAMRRVAEAPDGSLWAIVDRTVVHLTRDEAHVYSTATGAPLEHPSRLVVDREGRAWVATSLGVARIEDGAIDVLTALDGLPSDKITALMIATDGDVWIGTSNGGARFDGDRITELGDIQAFDAGTIICFHEGPDDTVWIGTLRGLIKHADGALQMVREDVNVRALDSDARGRIWIATTDGVRVSDDFAWNDTPQLRHLDGSVVHDLRQGADGSLWVLAANQVVRYRPHDAHPEAFLTSARSSAGPLDLSQPIEADTSDVVTIALGARGLRTAHDDLMFRHRVIGHDDDWKLTRGDEIALTGLPPGRYELEFEAIGSDLSYSQSPATTTLIVREPPGPLMAVLGWGFGGLAAVFLAFQLVRHQQSVRRVHAELKDNVRTRTSELHDANTNLQSEVAQRREVERAHDVLMEQLVQSQKMEAIGTLSAGVAHDFNNTLTAILAAAESVDHAAAGPEVKAAYAEIREACEQANGVTRSLLEMSGKAPFIREPIELVALTHDVMALLRHLLPAAIHLDVKAPELGAWLEGDRSQLQQVIMNLALNARDAMPDGGTLTIAVATEPGEDASPETVLTVSDTGIGIDEARQRRVFEPFFTTKARGRGTGLGLAMAYGVVTRHGGTISVDSATDVGTAFRLRFPAIPPRATESKVAEQPKAEPTAGGQLILLVEDRAQVRDALERALVKAGYRIVTAGDGEVAVERFTQYRTELVGAVMDIDLPKFSGVTVLEKIRAIRPDFPVVLISGDPGTAPPPTPGVTFLAKPFRPTELASRLAPLLPKAASDQDNRRESSA